MNITTEMLEKYGFKHEKFPDGWFWHTEPDTKVRLKLSKILGYQASSLEDIPDDFIIQTDDSLIDWQFVYGADVGSMSYKEVVETLNYLDECHKEAHRIVSGTFTSIWDDSSTIVSTHCKIDLDTKEVFDIEKCPTDVDVDILNAEEIEYHEKNRLVKYPVYSLETCENEGYIPGEVFYYR